MNRDELSILLDIYDSFLMLSSYESTGSDVGHGEQVICADNHLFQQHLRSKGIYPGSMILEGVLQSAAALIYLRSPRKTLPIIFSIKARIFKPVTLHAPTILMHKVSLIREVRGICDIKADTFAGNQMISRYSLGYALRSDADDYSNTIASNIHNH